MSAISSIFIKTFWIFFVKDLANHLLFLLFVSFWERSFLARIRGLKNGDLFQCPLGPISIILNFQEKKFGESWHQTAFTPLLISPCLTGCFQCRIHFPQRVGTRFPAVFDLGAIHILCKHLKGGGGGVKKLSLLLIFSNIYNWCQDLSFRRKLRPCKSC